MGSPSALHEGLVRLFENRPGLAPELLRDVLGVPLPAYAEVRLGSSSLTTLEPRVLFDERRMESTEYRADLVVLLVDGKPVLAILVEVQLKRDARKLRSWPVKVVNLRARHGCPVCLLVVTPSEAVAKWASAPIALGPGSVITPSVVGPSRVPVVGVDVAKRDPELAVLAAMAHGRKPELALSIARASHAACRHLHDDRKLLYCDLIVPSLGEAARIAFEEFMDLRNYEFQSEFLKKRIADGIAEGIAEGMAAGMAAGRAAGRAAGKAEDVLAVLDARGIALSRKQKRLVLACTDVTRLDRWIRKAVTIASANELFAD